MSLHPTAEPFFMCIVCTQHTKRQRLHLRLRSPSGLPPIVLLCCHAILFRHATMEHCLSPFVFAVAHSE